MGELEGVTGIKGIRELNYKLVFIGVNIRVQNNQFAEDVQEDEEEEEKRRKREEFKKKRTDHYKEFQMIKQMKNHGWEDDEDEQG